MNEVFLIEARRTPFGSFGGSLRDIPAPELASQVLRDIIQRQTVPAAAIDEVIIGQVLQSGCGQAPGRQAMRKGDVTIDSDEEPGRGAIDKLSGLRPAFTQEGTITAGNASTINDGPPSLWSVPGKRCSATT